MNIECHILCRDEAEIFLYAARHYTSFCSRIVLHDMGSTDGTLDVAAQFGIEVRHWDTGNKVDDRVNMRIKNEAWIGTNADWVICVDTDELIYFPSGVGPTLRVYDTPKTPMIRPTGFEMFSETMPTTPGQIYDEIKSGARDNIYSKPVLFNPRLVVETNFRPGAHSSDALFKDGTRYLNPVDPPNPPVYLLHYHQIGPIEKIAARYDRTRARMCDANVQNGWGNFEPGIKHATDKRNFIESHLERVIP